MGTDHCRPALRCSDLTADRCMRISLLFFTSFCISDNVCGPVAPLIGSCYTQQSYDTRGTTLLWSAAYKWFPLALHCSWVRLQCASGLQNMTTHHLPHSLAQSRQLPGIDFSFPFSLSLSHSVLFFPPWLSLSRRSADNPLIQPTENQSNLIQVGILWAHILTSWLPEEVEEHRFVCFTHTYIQKSTPAPCVLEVYQQLKKGPLGWMIIFFC